MIYRCYKRGIRLSGNTSRGPGALGRKKITVFSEASKKRLEWVELNGPWVSMITLTYHEQDNYCNEMGEIGYKVLKCHMNSWLQNLRDKKIKYLWAKEFQERGVVHYHVMMDKRFTDCALWDDVGNKSWRPLMLSWLRITGQSDDKKAVDFSLHQSQYVDWEIRKKGYLNKYLGKNKQKILPFGIKNIGKWWGCSRDLVLEVGKKEVVENIENMESWQNHLKGWKQFKRQTRKLVEKKYNYKFPNRGFDAPIRWLMSVELVACVNRLCETYFKVDSGMKENKVFKKKELLFVNKKDVDKIEMVKKYFGGLAVKIN